MRETVKATSDLVACTHEQGAQPANKNSGGRSRLFESVTNARELAEGFELTFPAGSLARVRDFVEVERQCCGFLTFTIDDREDETRLTLVGPEGTKAFVRQMIHPGVSSGA